MDKFRYTAFDEEILDAMISYNSKTESEKFTLIDARIISIIHSLAYAGETCFASNKYFAQRCFTTQATIQKSINKLISHNLINKTISYTKGKKQRILIYNENETNKFKKINELVYSVY